MPASKDRLLWTDVPAGLKAEVERVMGAPVVAARNCPGGFSPGLASRLTDARGGRLFVKAIDAHAWPHGAEIHRAEARVAAALPSSVPAPRLVRSIDDGRWVMLMFSDVDGAEPDRPWRRADLDRVVAAAGALAITLTPAPITLPTDHPRLGGWAELAADESCLAGLPAVSDWAARNLDRLIELEAAGLVAAHGPTLVHCDLYPFNTLLTADRVVFVDWPHARLGAPVIDLITLLSSAAADGIDPEPYLRAAPNEADRSGIDAILAAHGGFLLAGGLSPAPSGLEAIAAAKLQLGLGAVGWLEHRLTGGR
jgi:aminoglycoside phosphotransferase (APT) family kinase protein